MRRFVGQRFAHPPMQEWYPSRGPISPRNSFSQRHLRFFAHFFPPLFRP